jgi:hypothetical protein
MLAADAVDAIVKRERRMEAAMISSLKTQISFLPNMKIEMCG